MTEASIDDFYHLVEPLTAAIPQELEVLLCEICATTLGQTE